MVHDFLLGRTRDGAGLMLVVGGCGMAGAGGGDMSAMA